MLYFLLSTLVLTLYIDVVLSLSIGQISDFHCPGLFEYTARTPAMYASSLRYSREEVFP